MTIKHRLKRLEEASDSREKAIIVGYSEEELEKKTAEFKKENPYAPEPHGILVTYESSDLTTKPFD